MNTGTRLRRAAATFATAVGTVVAVTAPAPAASRAAVDLAVTSVRIEAAGSAPGGSLRVADVVARRGRLRAATDVRYFLSVDGRRDAADRSLGSRRLVAPGKGAARITIPIGTPPGRYFVIACADGARKLRERSEANNCRASDRRVQVKRTAPAFQAPVLAPPIAVTAPPAGGQAAAPAASSAGGTAPAPETPGSTAPAPTPTDPPGGQTDPGPAPGPGAPAPNPLTVKPTLDTDRGSWRTLGRSGGSFEVSGADGTRYILVLPEGALMADERITMTPLADVEDLPFDAFTGGVQLEPDGLRLSKPASLLIIPPTSPPAARLTTFGFRGAGEEFHLVPVEPTADYVELKLMHFSGYGAGDATDEQRKAQAERRPTSPEDQAKQRLAEILQGERACQLAGGTNCRGEDAEEALRTVLRNEYDRVWAALQAVQSTDEGLEDAIYEALAWARSVQLLGSTDFEAEQDTLGPAIETAVRNAYERAWQRCSGGDLSAPRRMMQLLRFSQLFGMTGFDDTKIDRCLHFELSVDFDFKQDFTQGLNTSKRRYAGGIVAPILISSLALTGDGPKDIAYSAHESEVTEKTEKKYSCTPPGSVEPQEYTETATRTTKESQVPGPGLDGTPRFALERLDFPVVNHRQGAPPPPPKPTLRLRVPQSGAYSYMRMEKIKEEASWSFIRSGSCGDDESDGGSDPATYRDTASLAASYMLGFYGGVSDQFVDFSAETWQGGPGLWTSQPAPRPENNSGATGWTGGAKLVLRHTPK